MSGYLGQFVSANTVGEGQEEGYPTQGLVISEQPDKGTLELLHENGRVDLCVGDIVRVDSLYKSTQDWMIAECEKRGFSPRIAPTDVSMG